MYGPGRDLFFVLMAWIVASVVATAEEPDQAAQREFFERQVRPILTRHCLSCHGGEAKIKGGLRLDSRAGWKTGGDSGPAIVAGDLDASLLIKAVRYSKDSYQMPPEGKLPDAAIRVLETWVQSGAFDPREGDAGAPRKGIDLEAGRSHWSYRPIQDFPVPNVSAPGTRSDIDRFLLAKMLTSGLTPVAEATPEELVRRLYFDLTGLPPTPEQLNDFCREPSETRYVELVDRLLASQAFAEHWGRHWLDIARYAESLTLRGFVLKDAWRYRDYVINSFNEDRPYDEFLREQIAGDLLPEGTLAERQRRLVATSYLALGNHNLEEQDKKTLEMDVVDEQLDVIGKGLLAQTVTCARCHDHKFDPIPTRDYYALAGILKSSPMLAHANVSMWTSRPLPLRPEEEAIHASHGNRIVNMTQELANRKQKLAKMSNTAGGAQPNVSSVASLPGRVIDDKEAQAIGTWKASQSVKPYIGDGYVHDDHEGLGNKSLTFQPKQLPPGKYEVRFAYTPGSNRATNVSIQISSADGDKTVKVNERLAPPLDSHFVSLGTYRHEPNGQFFVIVTNEGADGHVIADAVQFLTEEELAAMKQTPVVSTEKSDEQKALEKSIAELEKELKEAQKSGPVRPTVLSVTEAAKPADTYIHVRGLVSNQGPTVPRGFLQVATQTEVPSIPEGTSGRLELARWLTSTEQPLVPRVYVNRVWHWLFGAGLVRTPDNFGTTGEPPTHPELLDWLSRRFIDDGWSTKKLVRRIVLSQTYRLASQPGEQESRDPEHRLWSWRSRRRLPAESLRDTMLMVSGVLNECPGGSTYPVTRETDYGPPVEVPLRTVYLPAFRNATPEFLEVFDGADTSVVTGARNVSTVAPQSLFLMNHSWVQSQSKQIAERVLGNAQITDNNERLNWLHQSLLGRVPTSEEKNLLLEVVRTSSKSELERWTDVAHVLICSIEFRYVP